MLHDNVDDDDDDNDDDDDDDDDDNEIGAPSKHIAKLGKFLQLNP